MQGLHTVGRKPQWAESPMLLPWCQAGRVAVAGSGITKGSGFQTSKQEFNIEGCFEIQNMGEANIIDHFCRYVF